jgi:predicted ester cyclase
MEVQMSGNENVDLVRRRFEELDRGNFKVLDELFSPEYELRPGGESKALSLEETKDLYRRLYDAFPDLEHTLDDQLAGGDKVVTRWTATGTHERDFLGVKATGARVTFSGINIYTIEDGKFAGSDVSWDLLPIVRRLGVAPERASLSDVARGGDGEGSPDR